MDFGAKDPNDIDDFSLDWSNLLATGETIGTCTATVESGGVTVDSTAISSPVTTARISGGTLSATAAVRYRVTTSTGRQLDQTIRFSILEH